MVSWSEIIINIFKWSQKSDKKYYDCHENYPSKLITESHKIPNDSKKKDIVHLLTAIS